MPSLENKHATPTSLPDLETLIRAGNLAQVRKLIRDINRNAVTRPELLAYAAIANRVYEPRLAYRFLHNTVRSLKGVVNASREEKLEYAEALRGMGLIRESITLLEEIGGDDLPVIYLRLSFCHMTQWHYAEAIPCLKKYIAIADPTAYTVTIARVNLAAALVILRKDEEAHALLRALCDETSAKGLQLLHGNCLELTAQLYVLQSEHAKADKVFAEAEKLVGSAPTRYALYLRKWRAISRSLLSKSVDPDLLECQRVAKKESDWETLRECALYIGYLTKNQSLINEVYFGTPYQPYRQRVLDLLRGELQPSDEFVWVSDKSTSSSVVFDVLEGRFDGSESRLESGQLMHRFLILLASDFYRPITVGSAFSELFPGEHFFQVGSTNRICQVVKRLRDWFEENGNHFSIEENDGSYRLIPGPGVGLRVRREKVLLSAQALTWRNFIASLQGAEFFTRNDVVKQLECSLTGASRLIAWGIETKHCVSVGGGRNRKYRIVA